MNKIEKVTRKLRTDPNGYLMWMDGGYLPHCSYDTEELCGIQLSLILDGFDDVYIVSILPGDEYGTYDAWLRRMGEHDCIHMLSRKARDPEDVVVAVKEHLPDYLSELGDIM